MRDHARKLLEKYRGEPFFESPYNRASRMSPHSLQAGMSRLDKHFVLLRCDDDMLPSVDWVLDLARVAVLRCARTAGSAPDRPPRIRFAKFGTRPERPRPSAASPPGTVPAPDVVRV